MYAKQDILSNDRKRPPYALKGALLKHISTYLHICILEDKKGERFSTNVNNVQSDFVPRSLTKTEEALFSRLNKVLNMKGEKEYKSTYQKVVRDEITKFDLADDKKMWLEIAGMVYSEKFNKLINE